MQKACSFFHYLSGMLYATNKKSVFHFFLLSVGLNNIIKDKSDFNFSSFFLSLRFIYNFQNTSYLNSSLSAPSP